MHYLGAQGSGAEESKTVAKQQGVSGILCAELGGMGKVGTFFYLR